MQELNQRIELFNQAISKKYNCKLKHSKEWHKAEYISGLVNALKDSYKLLIPGKMCSLYQTLQAIETGIV